MPTTITAVVINDTYGTQLLFVLPKSSYADLSILKYNSMLAEAFITELNAYNVDFNISIFIYDVAYDNPAFLNTSVSGDISITTPSPIKEGLSYGFNIPITKIANI